MKSVNFINTCDTVEVTVLSILELKTDFGLFLFWHVIFETETHVGQAGLEFGIQLLEDGLKLLIFLIPHPQSWYAMPNLPESQSTMHVKGHVFK